MVQNWPLFWFQTWLAGPNDCGGARCPIPFNSELFVEGTYSGGGSDLCFMLPHNNKTLKLHGLCAIPVAMVPRTPLPPVDSCPKLQPGDDDWPFPNYSWNVEGQSGQILKQVKSYGSIYFLFYWLHILSFKRKTELPKEIECGLTAVIQL